ncbi:MAG: transcription antitermination protein NusB [Alphaproteobacteria bacterium]
MTAEHRRPSAKARNLSARLLAVQALYQSVQNKQRISKVTEEFLATRVGMEVDGETIVTPDGALFKKILGAIEERGDEINEIINANITNENKDVGMLLKAILMCASAELLVNRETEQGIIINDYLNVAHGFFDSGETGLVNAVLDAVAKVVRS